MKFCVKCGNELGIGRFCTNCGHPVDSPASPAASPVPPGLGSRTDTAERPAVPAPQPTSPLPTSPPPTTPPPPTQPAQPPLPPRTPPPVPAGSVPPAGPRFPLYADEVTHPVGSTPPTAPTTPTTPLAPTHHRRRRPWALWAAVAVVLVLVAGVGIWLRPGADGDGDGTDGTGGGGRSQPATGTSPSGAGPSTQAGDLTSQSTVEVPATAPPNQDTAGETVRYVGANMLDGVPETCWRMPGDGTGEEITITLPGETTLRRVGLINGYAKSARDAAGRELDWYHGNRRVQTVEWVFDDGTTLTQDLDDTTALQSVDIDDVTTSTITLRLVSVSPPGKGRAGRDYTAISDVSLVGAAG
jgi:hypothetical protein